MIRYHLEAFRATGLAAIMAAIVTLPAAHAAPPNPATATLNVQANVVEICKVAVSADVDFGDIDNPEANDDANGTIQWRCSPGTSGSVSLDAGLHESTPNDVTTRRMKDAGVNHIPYQLYTSNAYATIWGDGNNSSVTQPVLGTGIGDTGDLTVFGRIPANAASDKPLGPYSDQVQVNLDF